MKLTKEQLELVVATGITWLAALVYVVFPVDLVPDFVPVLGQLDDFLALLTAGGMSLHTWNKLRVPPVHDPLPDGLELLKEDDPEAYGWEAYKPLDAQELQAL